MSYDAKSNFNIWLILSHDKLSLGKFSSSPESFNDIEQQEL